MGNVLVHEIGCQCDSRCEALDRPMVSHVIARPLGPAYGTCPHQITPAAFCGEPECEWYKESWRGWPDGAL